MDCDYEALIVGAGPAGLSAAMTLGRMSRTALLCDDNRPRNAASSHINNFPSRDGIHPEAWRKLARQDLQKYPSIKTFEGSVLAVEKTNLRFVAKLSSGLVISVKKLILAYGVKDKLLDISGFAELWGNAIFHCPFCHGFEIRGSRLGIIGNGDMLFHTLPLIHDLASDLVIFTNGPADFSSEQRALLQRNSIEILEEPVERLIHEEGRLKAVVLKGGRSLERQYLFYPPPIPFELKSALGESLACEKTPLGYYKINERGETSVSGVFACGDNANFAHSVLLASASGVTAGAGVVIELLKDSFNKET